MVVGSIFALVATGLTMIFGVMKTSNFAHGQIYALGAYLTYGIASHFGLNSALALALSIPTLFALGIVVDKVLFSRLRRGTDISLLDASVITLGFAIFLDGFMLEIWGADYQKTPPILEGAVNIGPFLINSQRLIASSLAMAIIFALSLFVYKTKAGKAIRATQQRKDVARSLGINTDHIYALVLAIAFSLAGVAGGVLSSIYYIYPGMGMAFTLRAYVVVIVGGMGSIEGAVFASYLISFIEVFASIQIGFEYQPVIGYLIMIAILLIRPKGILSK
ncbi:MAG: branched-chain amino acid ABC transporter permease [Candidatus Hodarchaeota archaeon]